MYGYFVKNDLHKINVNGNGVTNYWIADDKKALIGANHAECSNMTIIVKEGAVKKRSKDHRNNASDIDLERHMRRLRLHHLASDLTPRMVRQQLARAAFKEDDCRRD